MKEYLDQNAKSKLIINGEVEILHQGEEIPHDGEDFYDVFDNAFKLANVKRLYYYPKTKKIYLYLNATSSYVTLDESPADYAAKYIDEEYQEEFVLAIKKLYEEESSTIEYYTKGKKRYLRNIFAVIKKDENNKPEVIFGLSEDLTAMIIKEKLQQEQLLELMREAMSANEAKTFFLSSISHDIRTPLNAIIGLIRLARMNVDNKENLLDKLDKMDNASKQLLSLINDVLDMNKIESGNIHLENINFNINKLIEESFNLVYEQALSRNISLNFISKNLFHQNFISSPLHIKQIIINLLSNAIKYNKENGFVNVEVREKRMNENKVNLIINVSDSGIGMDEETIQSIFEPFYQANNIYRSKFQGTGLGMSIVDRLLKKMNGTIKITSKIDVGTNIEIQLPLNIAQEDLIKEKEDISIVNVKGKRILLVDDNKLNSMIASEVLNTYGIIVETAENGQEALNIYKEKEDGYYDCILMDVRMPIMDGYLATEYIRKSEKKDAKSIPIFALTASTFVEDIVKAKEAGMNEHFPKPLNFDQIIKYIHKYTNGHK